MSHAKIQCRQNTAQITRICGPYFSFCVTSFPAFVKANLIFIKIPNFICNFSIFRLLFLFPKILVKPSIFGSPIYFYTYFLILSPYCVVYKSFQCLNFKPCDLVVNVPKFLSTPPFCISCLRSFKLAKHCRFSPSTFFYFLIKGAIKKNYKFSVVLNY